ncbi:MAG: AhpC/TSA family protein [Chitinophagaceae bacterium]|nr:MAG: AhpC/TSA family protein [Chitinophagaceae bacterium]
MKKVAIGVVLLLFCIVSSAQQKRMVVIKGTITGNLNGYNKMYMYTPTSNDSANIKDGHYTFSFPFKEVGMKMFVPEYVMKGRMSYRPFGILIDKSGTFYIITNVAHGMYNSEVKGSAATELYKNFGNDQDEAYTKINKALSKLYGEKWYMIEENEKDVHYGAFQKSQDSLQATYLTPVIEKLVKTHPNSVASAFVLATYSEGVGSLQQQEYLYSLLSPKIKKSKEGIRFYDYLQGVKNSAVGKEVKNFSLPNPEGKQINFGQFKGKYVLVDFWASWCGPCRQSFPKMRKMYAYYKDKGFQIYSISIDQSKKDWQKAVKEEKNPWPQSLDTKNIAQKRFAITAVPTAYLINPGGEIIAKQVGFDANEEGPVENKLDDLWGKIPVSPENKAITAKEKKTVKRIPASSIQ